MMQLIFKLIYYNIDVFNSVLASRRKAYCIQRLFVPILIHLT